MTAIVLRGDARHLPLADNTVDLLVTSPPYFALRSYTDGGEHYAGQIGSEPTPAEFLDALWGCTREWMRVLKPSGSIWVNLGDKYAMDDKWGGRSGDKNHASHHHVKRRTGIRSKSLMGLPWRYAIGCIDQLGLILRAEVIWDKPNGLPESVTDRVRRSHEQWFWFQQSGSEVVEPGPQALPLCSLCGRPADARSSLIARLHEAESGVEDFDLPDEVGANQRIQDEHAASSDQERVVGADCSAVPLPVEVDAAFVEDAVHLLEDRPVSVEDVDPKMGASRPSVGERHAPLAVDDSSEPREVCRCSHPFILDDAPWIPQEVAADIMQMVADGKVDAQHAADFLSGDYARTHSTWFHFTKQPRYFSAVDEIREPHESADRKGSRSSYKPGQTSGNTVDGLHVAKSDAGLPLNTLGKLPGSVWNIPSEPLTVPDHLGVDHFAAFPTEFPRRIIQGWSPAGICCECGEGRRPLSVGERTNGGAPVVGAAWNTSGKSETATGHRNNFQTVRSLVGYACSCGDTFAGIYRTDVGDDWELPDCRPAIVLDPFGGTGTTALCASVLGRIGISVDLSHDYSRIATWRTTDPGERARAARVPKPPVEAAGQIGLFE